MLSLSCPPSCLLLCLARDPVDLTSTETREAVGWDRSRPPTHSDAPLARPGLPLPPQRNPGSSYLLWAPRSSPSLGGVAGWPPWSPLALLRGITPPAFCALQGLLSVDKYICDPNSLLTCPHPSPGRTSRTAHYTCCLCLPFPWTRGRRSRQAPRASTLPDSTIPCPCSPPPGTLRHGLTARPSDGSCENHLPCWRLGPYSRDRARLRGAKASVEQTDASLVGPDLHAPRPRGFLPIPTLLLVQRLLPAASPPPALPVPRWTSSRGRAVAPEIPNPTLPSLCAWPVSP